MPNVLLRRHFTFPEHRPSGQQGAKPEPRRESEGLAEGVLMLENWPETTQRFAMKQNMFSGYHYISLLEMHRAH